MRKQGSFKEWERKYNQKKSIHGLKMVALRIEADKARARFFK